jgi:cupin 2 domain-containing protein
VRLEWSRAALADLGRFADFLHDRHPHLARVIASEISARRNGIRPNGDGRARSPAIAIFGVGMRSNLPVAGDATHRPEAEPRIRVDDVRTKMVLAGNLLEQLPRALQESLETVTSRGEVRFERIVSTGQASPTDFWYDQNENEFVVLLAGAATLRIEGEECVLEMRPGSFVEIPAHRRHRVECTQTDPPTIWLAVFFP